MAYIHVYSTRINWENEPSITSPINATNLNKMDYALKAMDDTLGSWDITKANESDLLLALKDVSYDTDTGVFVFTWFNGTTSTIDLNIEKIPVSFSMDANGVITMTTEDGTTYTADVGALIKTYTFTDSSVIDFTVTTDARGNKTVTADIVNGSIDGTKLTPNYLADCTQAKTGAETAATNSEASSQDAEAWAVGTRGGVPVPSTDPAYENNAEYWAHHTSASLAGLNDVNITSPTNGQVLTRRDGEWVNEDPQGGDTSDLIKWSEASKSVKKNLLKITITSGTTMGVTYTVNSDGSVTANGTASSGDSTRGFNLGRLPIGKYILTGCPSNGGSSKYDMRLGTTSDPSSSWGTYVGLDSGEGLSFEVSDSSLYYALALRVYSGYAANNLVFKPMLRLASIADDTYEPYIPDNVELNELKADKTQITNPNLLDNPWFTINQRGQSSYTPTHDNTYTVDRWKIENNVSGLSVTVNNDGSITLNNSSSELMYFDIANLLKDFVLDAGTKYTASVNVVSYTGNITVYVGSMNESPWTSWGGIQISKTGINTIPCEVPASYGGSVPTFRALIFVLNAGATLTIKAVKLELGSISTLALDTAPNYATELLKCQRYCIALNPNLHSYTVVGTGIAFSSTIATMIIPCPVAMRTNPVVVNRNAWYVRNSQIALIPTSASAYANGNCVKIDFTVSGGLTETQSYLIVCDSPADLMLLSADL